jgi:hypothetical protein
VAVLDDGVAGKLTPENAVERVRMWQQQSDEVTA